MNDLSFMWLEITGKCQLQCTHCYAESGPGGTDGAMVPADWKSVIDQAAGLGVEMVQFIGGEPTLHRSLPDLVDRAVGLGLRVEVFSNLVHVTPHLWDVFAQPGVQLATSYYSDQAGEHERITKGRGSHKRTQDNIVEALRRSIPLRVGVIDLGDGQRVDQARAELAALGVDGEVRVDRLRGVGRGVRAAAPDTSQLCGGCARGKVAVAADGSVWPCVFSRWLPVGNVRVDPLVEILNGRAMLDTEAILAEQFSSGPVFPCVPNMCDPQCGPSCSPACSPANNCTPVGACVPSEY
ncbi:radical SAM protein [Actinokineospora spheciospongiae]|uniref:radical SAM protein n=1 Tax=Actinokineospora spheciospongiae TaxID=909613 RepID=UPI000D889211|nr:radical SAM protein [Actinokineospora spheciospongiae]PWW64179.1 MoaA/NifB/PqqE/SkfB family radical SAM enzyme [Actinokineospora spheciospongiae]